MKNMGSRNHDRSKQHLQDKVTFEGEGNVTTEPAENGRPKRVVSSPVWHKDYVVG
jgi:hypothetical protein